MNTYGIIGNPLGHSFSKKYFEEKFEKNSILAQFLNFEIPSINDLAQVLENNDGLKGICVTIPYKEEVIPFLNEIDPLAEKLGAVNSVKITRKEGQLILKGYNTDIIGFGDSLKKFLNGAKPKALILGTGGASKAVAGALELQEIPYLFVSRTAKGKCISYEMLDEKMMTEHQLIINCSPLGTFPKIDTCPDIPYQYIGKEHFLYDLVYNPAQTLFMKKGAGNGAKTLNGLEMLHGQAEKNWEIWNES
jgi:shikimate dehydrogenase